MKPVSKFTLKAAGAIALASLSLTASVGAWAAEDKAKPEKPKKEKKAKKAAAAAPLKLSLSKEFSAVYDPIVKTYSSSTKPINPKLDPVKNAAAYKQAKAEYDASAVVAATAAAPSWGAIKAAIKNDDDKYQAGIFGSQIGREAKANAISTDAIELILGSATTPADQRLIYTFQKAATAYDAKDWANAEIWLIKSYEGGYKSNSIAGGVEMLIADSFNMQKKYPESLDWMQKSLDASKVPGTLALPDSFFARAANVALKSGNTGLISKWMRELVSSKPTADYWHDALMQTYKYAELDSQEVLDLMRLLRTVGGMKYEQNYSAYATDALIAFFPSEMKLVLEEGFAKGTISKSNSTFGGRYSDVVEKLKIDAFSIKVLDQDIAAAKTGAASAFAGDIALSVGEYARAKGAYEAALAKGAIVDKEGKDLSDRTLMRLGIAKLKLGDLVGAKADFAKITVPGRKAVADYWSLYAEQMEKGIAPTAG